MARIISEEYKAYIRSQPCLACRRRPPSDPDHLVARGWREPKRNDLTCVPLCRRCHNLRHTLGNEKFERRCSVNLWREAFFLLAEFVGFAADVYHACQDIGRALTRDEVRTLRKMLDDFR